jgi:Domain of unknown function (DUF1905)/Bacteriocin-protection, YdeI or OmpD-Associated
MTVHRFQAVLGAEGGGVFIEVPLDVPAVFGRARPAVRVTVNGHPFRSTVAVYGGRYYLPVKRAFREAAGGSRPATPWWWSWRRTRSRAPSRHPPTWPPPLPATRGAGRLRRPLLTHRREYVEWVTGAKRPETRRRRVQQAVLMLRDGRPHP